MAHPTNFEGANRIMIRPPSMKPDECSDLHTFCDGTQHVSCWRLTPDELAEIQRVGVVWLSVIGGQPPVKISGHALVAIDGRSARPIADDAESGQTWSA